MQNDKWQRFLVAVSERFPDVWRWLQELEQSAGVLLVWKEILSQITYEEAIEVLIQWSIGKTPAPTNFQRDQWALHIRQCALKNRQDKHRFELKETVRKPTREEYARNRDLNLVESFALVKALADEWKLGGMSEEEWQRRKMEIVRNVK